MRADNLEEARKLSIRYVPEYNFESVVDSSLDRLDPCYCTPGALLEDVRQDLVDMAVNMRAAHVAALEKLLDLRDVFAKTRAWCDEPGIDNDELAMRLADEIRKQHDSLTFRYGEKVV